MSGHTSRQLVLPKKLSLAKSSNRDFKRRPEQEYFADGMVDDITTTGLTAFAAFDATPADSPSTALAYILGSVILAWTGKPIEQLNGVSRRCA